MLFSLLCNCQTMFLFFSIIKCLSLSVSSICHHVSICAVSSEKGAFEHAQHAQIQIILRMRKGLSGPVLSIDALCNSLWLWSRTAKLLDRLHWCASWSRFSLPAYGQRHVFAWHDTYNIYTTKEVQEVQPSEIVLCFRYRKEEQMNQKIQSQTTQ